MQVRKLSNLFSNRGFTLAELTVTTGIVAILASIAVPTFAVYVKEARKLECQVSIVNYLRAQEMYYQEYNTFSAQNMKKGKATTKIAWIPKKRPDNPDKYRLPELGIEFRRDKFRGYRIRVWEIQKPKSFRQELWLELKTDEDLDKNGETDYYSYRKYRRSSTKGRWRVKNQLWFDFKGCPAYSSCR